MITTELEMLEEEAEIRFSEYILAIKSGDSLDNLNTLEDALFEALA